MLRSSAQARANGVTAWATADSRTTEKILQEDSRSKERTCFSRFHFYLSVHVNCVTCFIAIQQMEKHLQKPEEYDL